MKKWGVVLIILSVLAVGGSLIFFSSGGGPNFLRIKFQTSRAMKPETFNKNIPGFVKIDFKDRDTLFAEPEVEGEKGILLTLNAVREKKSDGGIYLRITRDGREVLGRRAKFKKKRLSFQFGESFRFKTSDRIELSFSGSGKAVIRNFIIYSIIPREERKYVFLIALDNLRGDRIGRVVNGVELTPNLNRFINDSVSFTRGYSQGSWTLPAFTSMFTGLYEYNHGITRENTLSGDIPLIPESFGRDYVSVSINGGAWLGPDITDQRGFDLFRIGSKIKDVDASEKFFESAIDFLEKNELPEMFLFMHTFSIHAPYHPPERFLLDLEKEPKYKFMKALIHHKKFSSDVPEEERLARVLLYDADVLAFDHYFGKFIRYLKKNGIYHRSTIGFTSDHGEEFFEHGGWFHGHSHYDEMIRIPVIIKFPGNRHAGLKVSDLAGIVDILPTLGDSLGIDIPEQMDGMSLMPMIRGERFPDRILVSSTTKCQIGKRGPRIVALLKGKYKYLYNIDNVNREGKPAVWKTLLARGEEELYDLDADPGELNNLIHARPDLVRMFRKERVAVMKRVRENFKAGNIKKRTLTDSDKEKLKTLGYL